MTRNYPPRWCHLLATTISTVDEVTQLKRLLAGKMGRLQSVLGLSARWHLWTFLHGALLEVHKAVLQIKKKLGTLDQYTDNDVVWVEELS